MHLDVVLDDRRGSIRNFGGHTYYIDTHIYLNASEPIEGQCNLPIAGLMPSYPQTKANIVRPV